MATPARTLFAYGTLCEPEVFTAVTGAQRQPEAALLSQFQRRAFRGEVFPGIVPAPGAMTEGVVYGGLDARHWRRLDAFESDFYDRLSVTVVVAGKRRRAGVYVVAPRYRRLLDVCDWDPDGFRREHLARYLKGPLYDS